MSPETLKIIIDAAKKATNRDQEKWRRVMLYAVKNGTGVYSTFFEPDVFIKELEEALKKE